MDLKIEEETVLDDEQMGRCMRIWATDLGGCARRQYHRIIGDTPLQSHYYSHRGSVVHKAMENFILGSNEPIDIGEIEEYTEHLTRDIPPLIDKLNRWMKETRLDLGGMETEVKYEMKLPLGYTLVRKIDILTPTHIIDIKSGRRKNDKALRASMIASKRAVEEAGEGKRDILIVSLGEDEPVEWDPFASPKTPIEVAEKETDDMIDEVIFMRERIRTGKPVPVARNMGLCGMCRFRDRCHGV